MTNQAKAKAEQLLKSWNVTGTFKDDKIFFDGIDMGFYSQTQEREYYLGQTSDTTLGVFAGQELRNEFAI